MKLLSEIHTKEFIPLWAFFLQNPAEVEQQILVISWSAYVILDKCISILNMGIVEFSKDAHWQQITIKLS